jgi:NAD(P)-dependent dehydrogenase (short-subunit alcohol dehydrogenase family)
LTAPIIRQVQILLRAYAWLLNMPFTVLVSGAASGLGAAFVEAYRARLDTLVIAIDRVPITTTSPNVVNLVVDVSSQQSINTFARQIEDRSINIVIHSAGIRGLVSAVEKDKPNDVPASETLSAMDADTMARTFQINATGTFMLLRALLPKLEKACNPKVIVMSSRMGSIDNNQLPNKDAGSAYAYRASKAAMNAVVRSFAVDVPNVTFVLCHPGRVETKLVQCREEGAISVDDSLSTILPLIDKWNKQDSGKFVDRFGETIPW